MTPRLPAMPPSLALRCVAVVAVFASSISCSRYAVDDEASPICNPTGRGNIDTGVWVGRGGCASATLPRAGRTDGAIPDGGVDSGWALSVGYEPSFGRKSFVLTNTTTGDSISKVFYTGAPEFTLYAGDYPLSGLRVQSGRNVFRAYDYPCSAFDCDDDPIAEEFSLDVSLAQ